MSLSILKDVRKIISGLNAGEIRESATRQPLVGLAVSNPATREAMEDFLAPAWLDPITRNRALHAINIAEGNKDRYDIVLCEPGMAVPRNGYLFDRTDPEPVVSAIVAEVAELELPLARTFPVFRRAVSAGLIHRVSRENALFALLTALPNVLPSFIELPWVAGEFATDTAFLTANQVRMALMLAAVHGREASYRDQKIELLTIGAGAFGWRAIARELAGKIPLGGGLIPKAAIAFAGTWVVGLGLEKLYRTGNGLSRREKRAAWEAALDEGKQVASGMAATYVPESKK
jgi:hypothetical protein